MAATVASPPDTALETPVPAGPATRARQRVVDLRSEVMRLRRARDLLATQFQVLRETMEKAEQVLADA